MFLNFWILIIFLINLLLLLFFHLGEIKVKPEIHSTDLFETKIRGCFNSKDLGRMKIKVMIKVVELKHLKYLYLAKSPLLSCERVTSSSINSVFMNQRIYNLQWVQLSSNLYTLG